MNEDFQQKLGSRLSVIMLSMNEEQSVAQIVPEITNLLPGCEVVLVDSSSDRTPEIAEKLGVKVIRQYPPRGYGVAMVAGLRAATREVIVTLDCDCSYPVATIPELVAPILRGNVDLVDGTRMGSWQRGMPILNYLANYFFALLATILFLRRITDLHSGMRAYSNAMIAKLDFHELNDALPVELLLKPISLGYRVSQIPIEYFPRVGESKMRPLSSAYWTLVRICHAKFSVRR